ncbi:MAG: hypothetical protein LBR16_04140 [Treponema sp.]|nr:hypothetical protein [Treponema sp.]
MKNNLFLVGGVFLLLVSVVLAGCYTMQPGDEKVMPLLGKYRLFCQLDYATIDTSAKPEDQRPVTHSRFGYVDVYSVVVKNKDGGFFVLREGIKRETFPEYLARNVSISKTEKLSLSALTTPQDTSLVEQHLFPAYASDFAVRSKWQVPMGNLRYAQATMWLVQQTNSKSEWLVKWPLPSIREDLIITFR